MRRAPRPFLGAGLCLALAGCLSASDPCPPGLVLEPTTRACVTADGGPDGDVRTDTCLEADALRWDAFHGAEGLVGAIEACAVRERCFTPPCDLSPCLAPEAGAATCWTCIEEETDCGIERCQSACLRSDDDATCRACMCEAGCVDAFATCAGATGFVACDAVHGRDFDASETALSALLLTRRKSATGFTRTERVSAETFFSEDLERSYVSNQWTSLHSVALGGVHHLVESMAGCQDVACGYRVSPILEDGTLGRPAATGKWAPEWVTHGIAHSAEGPALIQYAAGTSGGRVRVVEFRAVAGGAIQVEVALEAPWADPDGPAWDDLVPLEWAGQVAILAHRSGTDRVALAHLEVSTGGTRLVSDAAPTGWRGCDRAFAFELGGRWFVGQQDNAEADGAAVVRVYEPSHDAGAMAMGAAIAEASWPAGYVTFIPTRPAADTVALFAAGPTNDTVRFYPLALPVEGWSEQLTNPVGGRTWGLEPPWELAAIAPSSAWELP